MQNGPSWTKIKPFIGLVDDFPNVSCLVVFVHIFNDIIQVKWTLKVILPWSLYRNCFYL